MIRSYSPVSLLSTLLHPQKTAKRGDDAFRGIHFTRIPNKKNRQTRSSGQQRYDRDIRRHSRHVGSQLLDEKSGPGLSSWKLIRLGRPGVGEGGGLPSGNSSFIRNIIYRPLRVANVRNFLFIRAAVRRDGGWRPLGEKCFDIWILALLKCVVSFYSSLDGPPFLWWKEIFFKLSISSNQSTLFFYYSKTLRWRGNVVTWQLALNINVIHVCKSVSMLGW